MLPEALRSMCSKASCSPWRSATKCSVPFGRLSMASRLIISVHAASMVGNVWESSSSNRMSDFIFCAFSALCVSIFTPVFIQILTKVVNYVQTMCISLGKNITLHRI